MDKIGNRYIMKAIYNNLGGTLSQNLLIECIAIISDELKSKLENCEVFSVNNFGTFSYGYEKSPVSVDGENVYRTLVRFMPHDRLVELVRSRTEYIKSNITEKDLEK